MEGADMILVTCTNCGATFSVPRGVSAVKCPYCGYSLVLFEQEILGFPVYMMPVKLPKARAVEVLLEEMAKQVGVDEEFMGEVAKARVDTLLVPFVIFDSNGRLTFSYKHWRGDVRFLGEVAVPLNGWFTFLSGITIPPTARTPLDANLLEQSIIVPLEFNVKALKPEIKVEEREIRLPFGVGTIKKRVVIVDTGECKGFLPFGGNVECYDPKKEAEAIVKKKLDELMAARGTPDRKNYTIDVKPVSVVYVPIYYITYGDYVALVNASSGDVLFAPYEERKEHRMKMLGAALLSLLAGGVASVLLAHFAPILVGIASAAPFLFRALSKVQIFGTKASLFDMHRVELLRKRVNELKEKG